MISHKYLMRQALLRRTNVQKDSQSAILVSIVSGLLRIANGPFIIEMIATHLPLVLLTKILLIT